MTEQHPLESFAAKEASKQSLSIRCLSDGLTFSIAYTSGYSDVVDEGTLSLERNEGQSWLEAFQGLFFSHEFLSYPYAEVYCSILPEESTLVPRDLIEPGQEKLWLLKGIESQPARESEELHYLSYPIYRRGPKSIVFAIRRDLYQFLRRTYLTPKILPAGVGTIEVALFSGKEEPAKRLDVLFDENCFFLLVHQQGEELAYRQIKLRALTDPQEQAAEAVFHIFALWRALELDGEKDELVIWAKADGDADPEDDLTTPISQVGSCLESLLQTHISRVRRIDLSRLW